jgi:hypothetical protein
VHDLGKIVEVSPSDNTVNSFDEGSAMADKVRFVMCSQVAWFTFRFPWGASTTQVSGMFLDLHCDEKPRNEFFRVQNLASTEVFNLSSPGNILRTVKFLWSKKWEMAYRWLPSRYHG